MEKSGIEQEDLIADRDPHTVIDCQPKSTVEPTHSHSDELILRSFDKCLKDKRALEQFIRESLSSNDRLERLSANSYIHPNGFFKIPLLESDTYGPKIRLHVWTPSRIRPSDPFENLHTHHWDFESLILIGQLQHFIFCETSDQIFGMPYDRYSLKRTPQDGHYLIPTRVVLLQKAIETILDARANYSLGCDTIHQVYPVSPTDVTATLILQKRYTRRSNDVYLPTGVTHVSFGSIPRRPTPWELIEVISIVLRRYTHVTGRGDR